ncbi:hypothetical protein KKG46_01800 [Patescibacteria group bacterium]|nr:hypothetical protein [Patescibacteria group bacterium]
MQPFRYPKELEYFMLTTAVFISVVPALMISIFIKKINYKIIIPLVIVYAFILSQIGVLILYIFTPDKFGEYVIISILAVFLDLILLAILKQFKIKQIIKITILTILLTSLLHALNFYVFYHPKGIERTFKYCKTSIICWR